MLAGEKKIIPKLQYILRTSPCAGNPLFSTFDGVLRSGLSKIVNVELNGSQWKQASLPVQMGGPGERSACMLAPSDFLASAAVTQSLQNAILPESPSRTLRYLSPSASRTLRYRSPFPSRTFALSLAVSKPHFCATSHRLQAALLRYLSPSLNRTFALPLTVSKPHFCAISRRL